MANGHSGSKGVRNVLGNGDPATYGIEEDGPISDPLGDGVVVVEPQR